MKNKEEIIDRNELKKQLHFIFKEEFNESFHDIFTISQDEFKTKYLHRINIILKSYHQKLIPELRKNKDLFTKIYKLIFEDCYLPCKFLCQNTLNNKRNAEILKNFQHHCKENTIANHICQGQFLMVKDNLLKDYQFVICSNCDYVYKMKCILMYCPNDDCEFYSRYKNEYESNLIYATWDKYHCPIMLNQNMNCLICNNPLYLRGNNVYCSKCKIEKNPFEIEWKCILCHKKFTSGAKEYNPLEFYATKLSVKNSLVNQLIIKPLQLPCECDNNPLKLNYYHNERCKGVLYEGKIYEKKIIVCSVCKVFASVNKFKWICPICKKSFKCNNTRTFHNPNNIIENDEFKYEENKSVIEDKKNNNENNNFCKNEKKKSRHLSEDMKENVKEKYIENNKKLLIGIENYNSENIFRDKVKKKYSNNNINNYNDNLMTDPDMDTKLRKGISQNFPNNNNYINSYKELPIDKKMRDIQNLKLNNNEKKEKEEKKNVQNHPRIKKMVSDNINPRIHNNLLQRNSLIEDNLSFNEEDYNVITQLGEGTFGKIYLVEDHKKNLFCLKKMITSNKANYEELSREYDIFIKYKHKSILSILGISKKMIEETTYCIYILMEVAKTDWEKEINERQMKNKFYSEDELINILNQLTSALVYLQKNNISHRDIKAQNILVFENNIFKIADFGEAKQFKKKNDVMSTLRGTELYMSPLLFNGLQKRIFDIKHNPFKSDVFSLGMCLLFASTLRIKNLCKIRDCIDDVKLQIYLMKVVSHRYSLKFVKLLNQMLCYREESRPDFYELENILENY